jgi:ankyrin repeat protein
MTTLSENGADVKMMDAGGNTALHYSVCSEQTSIVAKLLAHRQKLNHKTKYKSPKIVSKIF